jgi:DNA topoisomerase-1
MDHKVYLTDPGIYKNGLVYYHHVTNKIVTSDIIKKLDSLKVPPAWTNVWYSSKRKCHILVTGIDQGGKKQYILSDSWIKTSNFEKYSRMKSFIKDLPQFKKKIKNNDSLTNLLFNLLIDTHIRVGNEIYAKQNKTYGLTTLRQKHLIIKDGKYHFSFIGKSSINHSIEIPEKYHSYLKKLITSEKNKPLFGIVNSEELNVFLKNNMGDYTCKDFRTYSANMIFIRSFLKHVKNGGNPKKIALTSIDSPANQLGHTRSISRKSYISNNLVNYCIDSFNTASNQDCQDLLNQCY